MYCASCGYRLSSEVDGVDLRCSECGRPFDIDDPRTWETRARPPRMLSGLLLAVGLFGVIFGWIAFAIRFDYGFEFTTAFTWFVAVGSAIALVAVVLAVRNRSWWGRLPLLAAAVLAGWAGIALGVDHGFRVWQSGPNPPDEAFADGAEGMAAIFAGWIPASIVVGGLFLILLPIASGRRRLPTRRATGSSAASPEAPPTAPPTAPIRQ